MPLAVCSPIDTLVKSGVYGNIVDKNVNFTLLHQKDTSLVKFTLYSDNDVTAVSSILKSLLGLIIPQVGHVYVSGMRKLLRLDNNTFLITTEGEARGVLFERLNYYLNGYQYGVLIDVTASLTVLRLDGYYIYPTLSGILSDLSKLPNVPHTCSVLSLDQSQMICHFDSIDRIIFYLERSYAFTIYSRIARLCLPMGLKIL